MTKISRLSVYARNQPGSRPCARHPVDVNKEVATQRPNGAPLPVIQFISSPQSPFPSRSSSARLGWTGHNLPERRLPMAAILYAVRAVDCNCNGKRLRMSRHACSRSHQVRDSDIPEVTGAWCAGVLHPPCCGAAGRPQSQNPSKSFIWWDACRRGAGLVEDRCAHSSLAW
jgi:hypothetical protein